MHNYAYAAATVAVIALVTAGLRFFPFVLFSGGRKTPAWLDSLGKGIPFAAIAMLVVYCLKEIRFTAAESWAPQAIAVACVALLHIWKKNTLLSIACGTAVYMLLIRLAL